MKAQESVIAIALSVASFSAMADIAVPMALVDEKGIGASIGQITVSESSTIGDRPRFPVSLARAPLET